MAGMMINNVAYSWSMIQLTSEKLTGSLDANPETLMGVSAIKWNIDKKTEVNYGLGGEPVNRGFGNTVYSASITMDYNTQAQLRALAGVSNLRELGEFDLIVSWASDLGVSVTSETVTLEGCYFSEDGLEVSQDDTNITKEFELNPFRIKIDEHAA